MASSDPNVQSASAPGALVPVTPGRLLDFPEDPGRVMLGLMREHGPLAALEQDGQRLVFVFGPELNKQVLTDLDTFHSSFFPCRGSRKSAQRRLTAGLLTMNGNTYARHRKVIAEPFQRAAIRRYHDSLKQLADEMLSSWSPGDTIDVYEAMTRFMLRVTCTVLFGVDRRGLAFEVGEMIAKWVHMNHSFGMNALIKQDGVSEQYDRLLAFADELESKIRELIETRKEEGDTGQDVLSLLLQGYEQEGMVSDAELVGQAAVLFGAAHLTSANTLTWTLTLLALHPEVTIKLLDELEASDGSASVAPDSPTALPYLEDVVRESMRVMPASGYSQRITTAGVRLQSSAGSALDLAPHTTVIFSQFVTHRYLESLYPEPTRFRPERWSGIRPTPYEYLPFGAGPRRCIGAQLALTVFRTALPMILKRYRLALPEGAEVSGRIIATMLSPTAPVKMQVHEHDRAYTKPNIAGNFGEMVTLGL